MRVSGAAPTPVSPGGLRHAELPSPEQASAEWGELAERSGNIFATPEWLSTWWRHFGHDRPLLGSEWRTGDGTLAAIVPLYLASTRPAKVVRFLGSGPSDGLGPIAAPQDTAVAAEALKRALATLPLPWDVFVGDHMVGREDWARRLGGEVVASDESPVVPIHGIRWDDFLAARSRNFRDQVRRRERKAQRELDLSYRLSDDPARLDTDLDALFALHAARWGAEGSGALGPARQAFHRDFARRALERGWLRLWVAEAGGRPAAAWYGFRFAGAEWYYQAGRDPAHERHSLGFVLLAHTLREAMGDGMREYRLLRGGEEYKARFAADDSGVTTVAVAGRLRGRAAIAAAHLARRLPASGRRLAKQLTG